MHKRIRLAVACISLASLLLALYVFVPVVDVSIYGALTRLVRNDSLITNTTRTHSHRNIWPFEPPDCSLSNQNDSKQVINLTDCDARLQLAQHAVSCEMMRAFDTLNDSSCEPQVKLIDCSQLNRSSLPCKQPFEYTLYDYHTQHHCLVDLASDIASRDSNLTVPKILHYVWFYENDKPLKLYAYLGLISTIRFQGTRTVYFWHDGNLPTGRWWHEFIGHLNQPWSSDEFIDSGKAFRQFN